MPLSNIIRDRASRILVAESEVSRKALKYIIHNQENPLPIRIKAQIELHKMGRHTSYVGVRDRCILSGKGKVTSHLVLVQHACI